MTSALRTIAILERESPDESYKHSTHFLIPAAWPLPGEQCGGRAVQAGRAPRGRCDGDRGAQVESEPDPGSLRGTLQLSVPPLLTSRVGVTKAGMLICHQDCHRCGRTNGLSSQGHEQLCIPTRHSLPAGPQQGPPEFSREACTHLGTLQAPGPPTKPYSPGPCLTFMTECPAIT